MAVPWLRILDVVIGVTDLARSRRIRQLSSDQQQLEVARAPVAAGGLESRLAAVVVAALKEAFDRDTRRLEQERQLLEAERVRVERSLKLELLGRAGDREVGRLRLVAVLAVGGWMVTLFFAMRLGRGAGVQRLLAGGWILLVAAIAASFMGQAAVARDLQRTADDPAVPSESISSGTAGALALWLVVAGLTLVGLAVLIASGQASPR
jgi:hypothetical protein